MHYEVVLGRLHRAFGDSPFTVGDIARRLEYDRLPVSGRDLWWEATEPPPSSEAADERARQHAKADVRRLYQMGLLSRAPSKRGRRPGRRPYEYKVTDKARRYLRWLAGPGILEGFRAFRTQGTGPLAIVAAERLLRRLRGVVGEDLKDWMCDDLQVYILQLRHPPSLSVYAEACRTIAIVCMIATLRAPIGIQIRSLEELAPFISATYKMAPDREAVVSKPSA